MDYKIKYSKRKTTALKIINGELFVIAPIGQSLRVTEDLIEKHRNWILKSIEKSQKNALLYPPLPEAEIKQMKKDAKKYFLEKTEFYAKIMGLTYGRITITSAKKRFGSCSQKKNLCFSYNLMRYPEAAREYVIVHELSHLVYMNHSKNFYALIERYMPDYKERNRLLK